MVWSINKINLDNAALYPILVLAGSFFVFDATYYMRGNSYLAVDSVHQALRADTLTAFER